MRSTPGTTFGLGWIACPLLGFLRGCEGRIQICALKHHHPDVFCVALLNAQPMGFYAPAQVAGDTRAHGVEVWPVLTPLSGSSSLLRRSRPALVAEPVASAWRRGDRPLARSGWPSGVPSDPRSAAAAMEVSDGL